MPPITAAIQRTNCKLKLRAAIFVVMLASAIFAPAQADARPQDKGGRQKHAERWKGKGDHKPGQWLRKYNNLPPAKQEEMLKQEPEFQQLPAERQQKLLERLRKFNQLPPDQRENMIGRMERFEQLTPEQRDKLLGFQRQLRALPADRQDPVRRAFRSLHRMTPDQRKQVYESPRFKQMFNEQEQQLIKNMAESDVDD